MIIITKVWTNNSEDPYVHLRTFKGIEVDDPEVFLDTISLGIEEKLANSNAIRLITDEGREVYPTIKVDRVSISLKED